MRTACFLFAIAALAIGAGANATPTRIMPLGDSITESSGGHASYRYWLWNDLLSAGYDPDFVGSRYGVHAGEPAFPDFDQDHEGHWGWRADQFRAQIAGWVTTCQPQVILIHLGHNDLWQGQGVANAIADLDAIIDTIRSVRPTAVFLLAQVIPAVDGIGLFQIPLLNDEIAALAARKHTEASPVLVVDQFTGFDPDVDTWTASILTNRVRSRWRTGGSRSSNRSCRIPSGLDRTRQRSPGSWRSRTHSGAR